MKKSDLIDRLAAFTQSTKKDAGQMLAALMAERDALAAELTRVRAQYGLADLWKLSNELSWSPKTRDIWSPETRDIADRIRASFTPKGDAK